MPAFGSMRQTIGKSLLNTAFLVLPLLYSGCGSPLGGVNTVSEGAVAAKNQLNVPVADGVIRNAQVSIVNARTGQVLFRGVDPDNDGTYAFDMERTTLAGILDADLLYLYAESTAQSSVDVNGAVQGLNAGQVRFKSFLPNGAVIKSILNVSDDLGADPRVNKKRAVTHFSNAKSLLAESKLIKDGVLTQPLRPGRAAPANVLTALPNQTAAVETALADPTSNLTKKFKLISMATKALVEDGVTTILQNQNTISVSEGDSLLLEVANNTGALNPVFQAKLADLNQRINNDLQDSLFTSSFDAGLNNNIQTVTSEEAAAAASSDVSIFIPGVDAPTIDATTGFEVPKSYLVRSAEINGQTLGFNFTPTKKRSRLNIDCQTNQGVCQ